jgi:hypothetical protein
MNFVTAFIEGQLGRNCGLPMGEGLKMLETAINGIQRGKIFCVASAPKVGKSTFVDSGFVIEPCLHVLDTNEVINKACAEILLNLSTALDDEVRQKLNEEYEKLQSQLLELDLFYLSYEIDRVNKEFDFITHFINKDFGISQVILPPGKFYKEKNFIPLSPSFLKGEAHYDKANPKDKLEIIKVSPELEEMVKATYIRRIIPLFGRYNEQGQQEEKGMITFLENKDNPTGIRNYFLDYAKRNGEFLYSSTTSKEGVKYTRMVGYKPHKPDKYVIIILDHIRKVLPERGYKMKEIIDKFSEYAVELRNTCKFTFVVIIHLNRDIMDTSRRSLDEDRIFPLAENIKDSGNLSEDADYVLTLFNPNDDKYNLKKHFGTVIKRPDNSLLYPNMRTIHLVEARPCYCPQHFRINMFGETKRFEQFKF